MSRFIVVILRTGNIPSDKQCGLLINSVDRLLFLQKVGELFGNVSDVVF